MKNIKWITGLVVMTIFLFNTAVAQDGGQSQEKKDEILIKAPKKVTKVETVKTDEERAEWNDQQEENDSKLKKYKKRKKVKKNKKKDFKGKGNAYGRDKDQSGKEFGKDRSDDAKSKKEIKEGEAGTKIDVKAPSSSTDAEVAPASIKSTKQQIQDIEAKLDRMNNVLKTKELSDDAKRKYAEKISAMEKELSLLRAKEDSVTE